MRQRQPSGPAARATARVAGPVAQRPEQPRQWSPAAQWPSGPAAQWPQRLGVGQLVHVHGTERDGHAVLDENRREDHAWKLT